MIAANRALSWAKTLLVLLTLADILVAGMQLSEGDFGRATWSLVIITAVWFLF
jgi:hypothetical protein